MPGPAFDLLEFEFAAVEGRPEIFDVITSDPIKDWAFKSCLCDGLATPRVLVDRDATLNSQTQTSTFH